MGYKELYEASKKKGSVVSMSPENWKWDEEGKQLIGKLTAIEELRSSKNKKEKYNLYTIETDDGPIKCTLGKGVDGKIPLKDHFGQIVALTFLGIKELDKGRKMNNFKVEILDGEISDSPKSSTRSNKKKFENPVDK